ncbi:hypothetical protein BJP25_16925 [Actinokineospora bangkokensis]|uniref:LTD domain-containing protein n=1 Tax=Actinokineospora bangkokensis TaxID=1193682 RepID=A0A1Q9LMV9_9PSEU|nr:hypothetical protein BJP25_16925 [Actinokineospora bangkokensis]
MLTAPAAAANTDIRINEVVTTGVVDDSVELVNTGTGTVDISGWVIKDEQDASAFTIPSGTTLGPRRYRAFDVHNAFGLGSADKARLFLPGGTQIDSVSWSTHGDSSWSRCTDGTGPLTAAGMTLGGPNSCPSSLPSSAWPGSGAVSTADGSNVFGPDLSGLYQDGSVLWAAQNSGKLWRLLPTSTGWTPDTSSGWGSGKRLKFPTISGYADSEGVTVTSAGAAGGVYVSSERSDASSGTSRTSVLRYDVSGTATTLTATREWNLTPALPPVGSNLGFEAITWVPDSTLTAAGFVDASTGAAYAPSGYGPHTGGVFFVGVEGTAMVHGFVLQDSGAFTRVASFGTGLAGVMELQWEPQAARLWAVCDDTCHGQHRTLRIQNGYFTTTAAFAKPAQMPDYNNEGFALSPTCANGTRSVTWSDDSNDDNHALRKGSVTC